MKLSRDLWRAARSLINYAAVALATAAACDLYHHFADDPPDTWTPPAADLRPGVIAGSAQ